MRRLDAEDIAEQLAGRAEVVCRAYLPAGRKDGNYWTIGDARGTKGRSTYVRLKGSLSGKGAAGRWTDAATGEYGNLLDVIRLTCSLASFPEVLAEAARFLNLPDQVAMPAQARERPERQNPEQAREAARRLVASSQSLRGSLAETYLGTRGINLGQDFAALRYHPRCYYAKDDAGKVEAWPTLVASVTNLRNEITGVSRTFLARDGLGKAPVDTQRRSKGELLGNGIRFGIVDDVMAAGEGIETTLSLRTALPKLPLIAGTSSNHLSAIEFPGTLRTLVVIRDNDPAGDAAMDALFTRGQAAGIEVILVEPELDDLNSDLMRLGAVRLIQTIQRQVPGKLLDRFMV